MKQIESIESLERASALLHPVRMRILARATEPVSAVELAKELGESPQKLNYHLKALVKAGLLAKVREEKKRNLTKAYYQARAKELWFSPTLVAREPGAETRDRVSLHNLLGLAQRLERDVIELLNSPEPKGRASLGVEAELRFADAKARQAFMEDYVAMLQELVRRHGGGSGGEAFRAVLAVYPETRKGDGGKHDGPA